ncbi:hypothetical protein GWO13_07070 [Candidatus Bathyarchaeota archaeon]|nr:hypothetical protein [Candidatus Bathyarchaeota archaeon]
MVKLKPKHKPIILMINGELYGVKEITDNPPPTKTGQTTTKFLTIKATNLTGQKKLTIHLDPRLLTALKDKNKPLPYIQ